MATEDAEGKLHDLALTDKEDINHLDKLPDEMVLEILQLLARTDPFDLVRMGNTCRRLNRLCRTPLLWADVTLNGFSSWRQLANVVAPRLHDGTRRVELSLKRRRNRHDHRDKHNQVLNSVLVLPVL